MRIIPIVPRGFCKGVVGAIKKVNEVIQNPSYPRPIYILGMIVHNKEVVNELTKQGVITLDDPSKTRLELLQEVNDGTVIITAHGVGNPIFDLLNQKGIPYVDATCKDVYQTRDLIQAHLQAHYQVLYIGKKNHPETEGVLSMDPSIQLIETPNDVYTLLPTDKSLFVTNQTTFSLYDLEPIYDLLRERFPTIEIAEEVCSATRVRQEAIVQTNQGVDVCLIVGDARSNNTRNLAKVSEEMTHTKTYLIEGVQDINPRWFHNDDIVSVSSGASTPNHTTKKVIDYLNQFDEFDEGTW